ncbi:MAG: Fmu (Sun) domain protein [Chitinophagaceae bacterium BSSC1]|nr:MAG: Fmu (Sun) domain protein [Chitinophagaceae bacterium BSSC1]
MSYLNQHLQTAIGIIDAYDGVVPLAAYLKNHFAANKKYGSKDRKNITHFCYAFFRLGHALKNHPPDQRIRVSIFLQSKEPGSWSILFEHSWLEAWSDSIDERLAFVKTAFPDFQLEHVFPWLTQIAKEIDPSGFLKSAFVQPDLFIRIRPGHHKKLIQKIADQQIPFLQLSEHCLALPSTSKLEGIVAMDQELVVQDASSQSIAQLLKQISFEQKKRIAFWDCCAASGGKTILTQDILGNLDITVSDIRSSILHNLSHRFQRAGIQHFHPIVADLSVEKPSLPQKKFDFIFCDVPCSGSGTWGRTPEQLYFFKESNIATFAKLQQSILKNVIPLLAPGGYLLFSTCSVFQAENDSNLDFLLNQDPHLKLMEAQYLKGYGMKADTMYAALIKKNA